MGSAWGDIGGWRVADPPVIDVLAPEFDPHAWDESIAGARTLLPEPEAS